MVRPFTITVLMLFPGDLITWTLEAYRVGGPPPPNSLMNMVLVWPDTMKMNVYDEWIPIDEPWLVLSIDDEMFTALSNKGIHHVYLGNNVASELNPSKMYIKEEIYLAKPCVINRVK